MVVGSLGLAGCGSDSDSDSPASTNGNSTQTHTITGTAAVGKAMTGTVVAVNADGTSTDPVTIGANGSFSIDVTAKPPYLVQATDATGVSLYSYAPGAGTANVTPLTDLTLYLAANGTNLQTLFDGWGSGEAQAITTAEMQEAAKVVTANLQSFYEQNGVPLNYNYFTEAFAPNGTGIDAVLDAITVVIDFNQADTSAAVAITGPQGVAINFNTQIDTSNIVVNTGGGTSGGIPSSSKWDLTYDVVSNGYAVSDTMRGLSGLEVPADETNAQTSVSGLAGTTAGTAGDISFSCTYSNVSFSRNINGSVGDQITYSADMRCTISGIATTSTYKLTWDRVQ